jgi:hypothetical protein
MAEQTDFSEHMDGFIFHLTFWINNDLLVNVDGLPRKRFPFAKCTQLCESPMFDILHKSNSIFPTNQVIITVTGGCHSSQGIDVFRHLMLVLLNNIEGHQKEIEVLMLVNRKLQEEVGRLEHLLQNNIEETDEQENAERSNAAAEQQQGIGHLF